MVDRDIISEAFENLHRFEELNGIEHSKRKRTDGSRFIKIGNELIAIDSIMHVRKVKKIGSRNYWHIEITPYYGAAFNVINEISNDYDFTLIQADNAIKHIIKSLYFQEDEEK